MPDSIATPEVANTRCLEVFPLWVIVEVHVGKALHSSVSTTSVCQLRVVLGRLSARLCVEQSLLENIKLDANTDNTGVSMIYMKIQANAEVWFELLTSLTCFTFSFVGRLSGVLSSLSSVSKRRVRSTVHVL